jgi:hypothetical protein
MQVALLILFSPTPPVNWECPDAKIVMKRLRQLIDLGFRLNAMVMEETLHLFEHRLNEIGDILFEAFRMIHKKSKSDIAKRFRLEEINVPVGERGREKMIPERI